MTNNSENRMAAWTKGLALGAVAIAGVMTIASPQARAATCGAGNTIIDFPFVGTQGVANGNGSCFLNTMLGSFNLSANGNDLGGGSANMFGNTVIGIADLSGNGNALAVSFFSSGDADINLNYVIGNGSGSGNGNGIGFLAGERQRLHRGQYHCRGPLRVAERQRSWFLRGLGNAVMVDNLIVGDGSVTGNGNGLGIFGFTGRRQRDRHRQYGRRRRLAHRQRQRHRLF